ncbi:MAG TPA: hypothetical protein VN153_04815 [Tahibacter sp.]|nr:hypothetical protein [Tahibacter sp.]
MNRWMRAAAAVLLACVVAACGPVKSDHMTRVERGLSPSPDSAVIVFLRPSGYGGGVQSSVYDVSRSGGQEFIGIVSGGTKIAHAVAPGKYLFMVIGENADFMDAEVEAGKTYYVLVAPRMGMFKARFSLLPIHPDARAKYSIDSERFREWQRDTYWVENGPTAQRWYSESRESIDRKRITYKRTWNGRSTEDKAELYLHAEDGI